MNELKLFLIPYPKVPNSSCLGNVFILKFMIENRNFLKIAPISQYHACLLYTSDNTSCKKTHFIFNHMLPQLEIQIRPTTNSLVFEKKAEENRERKPDAGIELAVCCSTN